MRGSLPMRQRANAVRCRGGGFQQRDVRFGRTDLVVDPQGRNIIFTLQLAEAYYAQPAQCRASWGRPSIRPNLQRADGRGSFAERRADAAAAYKIQPGPFDLPFVTLPREINLGSDALREQYAQQSLEIGGVIRRPEPLVYYAAVLDASPHSKEKAAAFVTWLTGNGQAFFRRYLRSADGSIPAAWLGSRATWSCKNRAAAILFAAALLYPFAGLSGPGGPVALGRRLDDRGLGSRLAGLHRHRDGRRRRARDADGPLHRALRDARTAVVKRSS